MSFDIVFSNPPFDVKADYQTLHFDSSGEFASLSDGVKPHFNCPNCKTKWQGLFQTAVATEINQLISFKCPNCQKVTSLYVAIHGSQLCIQKSCEEGAGGIPANWWVNT